MTAVVEPKKKAKKVDMETLDNGTIVITEDEPATAESAPAPLPPEPGESGFDWDAVYPGEKVFIHTHDGVTVGFAAISATRQPDIGFFLDTMDKPEFEQVLHMLRVIADPVALRLVRPWKPTDLIGVFDKWSTWNRSNAGE